MTTETAPTHSDDRRGSATAPAARDPESQDSQQGTAGHAGKTVGLLLACTNLVIVLAVLCTTAFYFVMRGNDVEKFAPHTLMQKASWNMLETFKPDAAIYYNIRSIYERELFLSNSSRLIWRLGRSLQIVSHLQLNHPDSILSSDKEMTDVASASGYPRLVHQIMNVNRTFYEFIQFVPQHNIQSKVQKMQKLVDGFMSHYFTSSGSETVKTRFPSSYGDNSTGDDLVSKYSPDRIWLGAVVLTAEMLEFLIPIIPKLVEQVRVHGSVQLHATKGTPTNYYRPIYTKLNNVCMSFNGLCSILADIGLALYGADVKKK